MTSEKNPNILSDPEILRVAVATLIKLERRTRRIENFLASKFGQEFADFAPDDSAAYNLRKTILDYHEDALGLMESN